MTAGTPVTKALMAGVTAVTTVWLVVVLAWPDAPFALTFDDAWYYFGIARNLAAGNGSTFDGINVTNGYHPLWILVCVGAFKAGLDDLAAARVLLALQVMVYGLALSVLVQTVMPFTAGWPAVTRHRPKELKTGSLIIAAAFTVVAGNPFVVKTFVNGLETGVSVLPLALVLWCGVKAKGLWLTGLTAPQRRGASVILAVAFLARTDAAFLLACIAVGCAVEWLRGDRKNILAAAELLACPVAVATSYLVFNQVRYGGFLQVSGLVKRADLGVANTAGFATFLIAAAAIQRHGFRRSQEVADETSVRPRPSGRFPRTASFVHCTSWYAAFCIVVMGYYVMLQTQIWLWYFCPVALYGLVLLALASADFSEEALRTARKGAGVQRALTPVWLIMGLPLLVAFVFTGDQFADPHLRSIQIANADTGTWMREHTDPEAVFASWDAGALGYFSHRSVVNLDGVVNSHEYYRVLRSGQGSEIRRFLSCERVRFFVNHGGDVDGEDPDMRPQIAAIYGRQIADEARVVYRQPFTFSGVTSGDSGFDSGGLRQMAVHVYELPQQASEPVGDCSLTG